MPLQPRITLAPSLSGSWPFRRNLRIWPPAAGNHHGHRETGRRRPVRGSPRRVAATPGKFYHRACVGGGYPAAHARRGLSWSESDAQILVSTPRPPGVPEIFFFQAEDGIRDLTVTGVQTCALPI